MTINTTPLTYVGFSSILLFQGNRAGHNISAISILFFLTGRLALLSLKWDSWLVGNLFPFYSTKQQRDVVLFFRDAVMKLWWGKTIKGTLGPIACHNNTRVISWAAFLLKWTQKTNWKQQASGHLVFSSINTSTSSAWVSDKGCKWSQLWCHLFTVTTPASHTYLLVNATKCTNENRHPRGFRLGLKKCRIQHRFKELPVD